MRWWARVLPWCAALLVVAGCDLRPVADQVSVIDTFAVPTSVQQPSRPPADELPDDIPRVVAEPIDVDEASGGEALDDEAPGDPAAATGNPNEHRSQADPATAAPGAAADGSDDAARGDDAPTERPQAGPTAPADDDGPSGDGPDGDEPAGAEQAGDAGASTESTDESTDRATGRRDRGRPGAGASGPGRPAEVPTVPLSAIEREIVDLLNAERAAAGLEPVRVDARLTHGARSWATTMATGGAFTHESEGGYSENIAYGYADAAEVHEAWMSSPGHRGNRLRGGVEAYGIGVRAAGTTLYFVERFQ
jgi:uncharacterized protein YkwD